MPKPDSRYRVRIIAEEINPQNGELVKVMSRLEYPLIDYGTLVDMEDTVMNALIDKGKQFAKAIGQGPDSSRLMPQPEIYRDR